MINSPNGNNHQYMQKRVLITSDQQSAIEKIALHLKKQAPARFILVADRNGHIVVFSGEGMAEETMAELAALLAGDLAASQEIARLTGASQNQQLILREGETLNTFLCEAGADLVLFMQAATEVPLGWARLLALEACEKLSTLILEPGEMAGTVDAGLAGLGKNLDDAIDGLWN
jgi:predicted regulator of Ras-like GTPase activity (Roadblock/LC7/MglB family)